jgi:glycosyltransferase involved in cell wall biosynthesis
MRIMHVITALPTGGAETMLLKLLSATKEDHSQAVVSLMDQGTIGPRIVDLGVPVYTLGLRRGVLNPFRILSIRSLLRKFRPQLIQGWMYHGNVVASVAAALTPGPTLVVWSVHQTLDHVANFGRMTAAIIRLGALMSRHPRAIVYVSRIGAKQHEDFGYQKGKGIVIPNGIDCEVFRPVTTCAKAVRFELGLGNDTILIGLVARFHPMKDHAGFLRAAGLVAAHHPEARFVLIGKDVSGEQPALREIIAEQRLQDRVFLLGERSDTPRLIAALDIACSASAWGEAFSLAIGEAMACGVPCVVTDVGDSAYIVGDTGLSVPPREPLALAQTIGRLIDAGVAYRRQLGTAARRRVESEFSLPAIARRYDKLYRQVLPSVPN